MDFWGHLRTINHHKLLVMRHCFRVGLYRQGLTHDLSKYAPVEFFNGVRYFQATRSPNHAERQAKGYTAAWLHHKGRNKHHMEYWIDYNSQCGGKMAGIEMPVRYVAEMFCDRVAASKTYLKDAYTDASPWEYYDANKSHYLLHPNTRTLLEQLLQLLRDQGEQAAFTYIRRQLLGKK